MQDVIIPESERGALSWAGRPYGTSVRGVPLTVHLPPAPGDLLVFAGIHGNEADTTALVSAALRSIRREALRCAVVLCANPDGTVLGTRGNASGVDLNRNFPTANWSPEPPLHSWKMDGRQNTRLSPGASAGSEPETRALVSLVEELEPKAVVAMHSDLACIDDPASSPLGRWLSARTGLPLVPGVGYPTPGSFGSWCAERNLTVITYELEPAGQKALRDHHEAVLIDVLLGRAPAS